MILVGINVKKWTVECLFTRFAGKDDSDSGESFGKRKRRISSVSFDEIPVDKQLVCTY